MKRRVKSTSYHKQKKKRSKKYKGSVAQSLLAKGEKNYQPSIDYLFGYNSNIKLLSSQLKHFNTPIYAPSILNAFEGIQDKLASFNNFESTLPSFGIMDSQIAAVSRSATLAYTGLSNLGFVNNLAALATPKYENWYKNKLIGSGLIDGPIFSNLNVLDANSSVSRMIESQKLAALSLQSSLGKATEYALFTEKSLSNFPWADLGSRINLEVSVRDTLGSSFVSLFENYTDLLKSFDELPSSYLDLGPLVAKQVPVEIYTGANLLELISGEEEITTEEELIKNEILFENEYSLNTYLPKLDPGLLKMWQGAIESFHSNNSDRTRHFTTSLRELFTHVIHILAPNDKIIGWTNNSIFYNNGQPTRRARLKYICRNIDTKPFDDFVEKDIQATIELITIFQGGTHSIDSKFNESQMIALKSKAESSLKFLLEIEYGINR